MKNYDKSIMSTYLEYLDANNLYGWTMSQKLPVDGFKWVKDLIKLMMKKVITDIFLKQMLSIQKIFVSSIVTYNFFLKEWKSVNEKSLFVPYITKKLCYSHKCIKTSVKLRINTKKST